MTDDSQQILSALAFGVAGDTDRGLSELQPIVERGPGSTYALLGELAEATCATVRDRGPDDWFGVDVSLLTPDGVTDVSVDELPIPIRFAALFITAWANREWDLADVLFKGLVHAQEVGAGVIAVYEIAVSTARNIVTVERRADGT